MLSDVQFFNLLLMREIDDICKENDIEYCLAGGSVIGALRHKGFIPWDDDMDVYMSRDNWNKFKEAFAKANLPNRILESSDINPNYPNMIAKYTSTDTTAIYRNLLSGDFGAGIIIDMFILDPVPSDPKIQQEHLRNLLVYSEFVNPYYVFSQRFEVGDEYDKWLEREKEVGHEQVVRELEAKLTQYTEEESDTYILRWGGIPHVFDKSLFWPARVVPVEDDAYPIPAKSFLYLSQLYGEDWVQLPPEDEELTHKVLFSTEQSYTEFFDRFNPVFDKKAHLKASLARKHNRIKVGPSYRAIQTAAMTFEARKLAMGVKRADAEYGLRSLLEQGELSKLEELLGEYLGTQCSSTFLGNKYFAGITRYENPIYCDIGDDLLWVVIELLARRGRLFHPKRVLEARMQANGPLSAELEVQWRNVQRLRSAADLFEREHYDEVREIVDAGLAEKPEWVGFIKLKYFLLALQGEAAHGQMAELVERGMELNPAEGEWLKFKGDLAQSEDEAIELYLQAQATTRNGYALLGIKEFFEERLAQAAGDVEQLLGEGQQQAALERVRTYGVFFDGLRAYTNPKLIECEDDAEFLSDRLVHDMVLFREEGGTEYREYFEAAFAKMGAGPEHAEMLDKLWNAAVSFEMLDEKTVQACEACDNGMVQLALGDYLFSWRDYPNAFDKYYRAIDLADGNEFLLRALRIVFRRDMLRFYEMFGMTVPGSTKAEQCYAEWEKRHGNVARWVSAVRAVGLVPDDALAGVFDIYAQSSLGSHGGEGALAAWGRSEAEDGPSDDGFDVSSVQTEDAEDFYSSDSEQELSLRAYLLKNWEDDSDPFGDFAGVVDKQGDLVAFVSLLDSFIRAQVR